MNGAKRKVARRFLPALVLTVALVAGLFALSGCGTSTMVLGTTTSLQQSGLLAKVLPGFEKQYNARVTVVAKNTAAEVLALGAAGKADVLLVNNRDGVADFVDKGQGSNDKDVMYGDLVVVGPSSDPAQIKGLDCPCKSCKKIGTVGATFVARGDGSDVSTKVMGYWKKTGIDPTGQAWFVVSGSGMSPTLKTASEKQAYTITDMLTWLKTQKNLKLEKLVSGCTMLFDQYTAVVVNPAKHPDQKLNTKDAQNFVNYLASNGVQKQIGEYTAYGAVLYHPNAPKPGQSMPQSTMPMKM